MAGSCVPPAPPPPSPRPPPIFLPFRTPTSPTLQQNTTLNFLDNAWCPSNDTTVSVSVSTPPVPSIGQMWRLSKAYVITITAISFTSLTFIRNAIVGDTRNPLNFDVRTYTKAPGSQWNIDPTSGPVLPSMGSTLEFLPDGNLLSDGITYNITFKGVGASSNIKISANNPDAKYQTWKTRGFAPMILARPVSGTSKIEFSCKLRLDVKFVNNIDCYSGIMLLDTNYNPLFECGIGFLGSWAVPIENTSSPDPNGSIGGDSLIPDRLVTIFQSHYEELTTFTSSDVRYGSEVPIQVNFNQTSGALDFFDGFNTHRATTQFTAAYVAIFMRGYGENSVTLSEIVYNGLTDHVPPKLGSTVDNLIIEKKTLVDDFTLIEGNSDFSNCQTLCELNNSCRGFIHDDTMNYCTLKSYIKTEELIDTVITNYRTSSLEVSGENKIVVYVLTDTNNRGSSGRIRFYNGLLNTYEFDGVTSALNPPECIIEINGAVTFTSGYIRLELRIGGSSGTIKDIFYGEFLSTLNGDMYSIISPYSGPLNVVGKKIRLVDRSGNPFISFPSTFEISSINESFYLGDKNASLTPLLISFSPMPGNSNKLTSNIYIPEKKIVPISSFFVFNDNMGNMSSLVVNSNFSLITFCIDNSGGYQDFLATSNKGDVYITGFTYETILHPETKKGALTIKVEIEETTMYIVSKAGVNFKEVIFLSGDKTTKLDPTKAAVNTGFNLIGSDLTTTFEQFSILYTSSTPMFARTSSNSFTISATTPKRFSTYTLQGSPQTTPGPVNVKISPCKIILTNSPSTRLMILSPGMLYLINEDSIFAPVLSRGTMFTNLPSVIDLNSALTASLATPIPPEFQIPSSISFTDAQLNGGIYKFADSETTYVIQFKGGNRITYYAFGFSFTYVFVKSSNGSVYFTDNSGTQHVIYIDPLTYLMYDTWGDGSSVVGPLNPCISPEVIGNSYVFTSQKSNGKYRIQVISIDSFNYVKIREYDECPNDDVVWIMAYQHMVTGITKKIIISSIVPIANYNTYDRNGFLLNYVYDINYENDEQTVNSQSVLLWDNGLGYIYRTFITNEQYSELRFGSSPITIGPTGDMGKKAIVGGQFFAYFSTEQGVTFPDYSSLIVFDIGGANTCREYGPGTFGQQFTQIRNGTYSIVPGNNPQNIYEYNVRLTFTDGTTKNFTSDKFKPYLLKTQGSNVTYRATTVDIDNWEVFFASKVEDIGKIQITVVNRTSIRVQLIGSSIELGERIQIVTNPIINFTNAPTTWSILGDTFTLNTNTPIPFGNYTMTISLPYFYVTERSESKSFSVISDP